MRALIRIIVRTYQLTLSPLLVAISGPGSGCRFHPSCSEYFLQAIQSHGTVRGIFLGLKRIARCHPWGGCGEDPVPPPRNDVDLARRCA
jgi:putative membrane protein insertion efficiency factor